MIPLHPKILHFPIALLLTALLTAVLAIFFKSKRDFFKEMLLWLLLLGGLAAIATVIAGFIAEAQLTHNQAIHELLELHKRLAITLTSGIILAFLWLWIRKNKMQIKELILLTLLLASLSGLIGYTADLGGKMVYENGAGVIPMKELLEQSTHEHEAETQIPDHTDTTQYKQENTQSDAHSH